MTEVYSHRRIFGLDVVRSMAILLVLFAHVTSLVMSETTQSHLVHQLLSYPCILSAILGVEIFFVLSGFLIGQIVLREVLTNTANKKVWPRIWHFYVRRWLRTLPAYYAVLTIIVLVCLGAGVLGAHPLLLIDYTFLQNYFSYLNPKEIFGVSWSLAIEEWFYLLLPLYLLLTCRNPRHALPAILVAIIAIMAARAVFVLQFVQDFQTVRTYGILRFDGLLMGVALAAIKSYHGALYQRLCKAHFFVLALVLFGAVVAYFPLVHGKFYEVLDSYAWAKIFFLPLLNFCCVLVLPFMETSVFVNRTLGSKRIIAWFFTKVSLYSYALYLVHLDTFDVIRHFTGGSQLKLIPLELACALVATLALHHLVERPFMRLRERIA